MREIKFRGLTSDLSNKDLDEMGMPHENGWVYGDLIGNNIIAELLEEPNGEYLEFRWWAFIQEKTKGQYTGLKDMNGTEIYEGDIVKTVALSNDHNQRGAVIISSVKIWCGNACLTITYIPIYPFCIDHTLEVIGNIHDNPELLD